MFQFAGCDNNSINNCNSFYACIDYCSSIGNITKSSKTKINMFNITVDSHTLFYAVIQTMLKPSTGIE